MKSNLARAALALACLFLIAAAVAQDRPAKQNPAFNPAAAPANGFDSFTTGVVIKLKSAAIAQDGTITARFTLTDSNGNGLDYTGALTAGPVSLAFVAAYIPNGQAQYVAYTTTVDNSITNKNPPQVQAGTDSGGTYSLVDPASGTYDYTFKTKAPAGFDVTATHSIGAQASRNLSSYGYATAFTSDDVFTFVPNGSKVTNVRDVVTESACNNCHNPLSAHGGPRTEIKYCVLCHTPQSTNPDSLNTVDLKVFIHKIHMGSSLPSVQAGTPYYVEHRGSRVDFSTVVFPQDVRNCTTCHVPGATTQADNWKLNPTRATCGSCHDDVNFATGQNHVEVQVDDTQCKTCHTSTAHLDFDASIPGAHVVPNNSTSMPGVVVKIMKVDNGTAGSAPTVTFSVFDKSGNPYNDLSKFATARLVLGGPNTDYQTGPGGIRVTESVTAVQGTNGVFMYQMTNKIPAAATGSYTISIEAANNVTLLPGTTQATPAVDGAIPFEFYFSVDKSPMFPRRVVVATANCAKCHQNLEFVHGGTRPATQECTICHNPTLTDGTSKDSVSMATQIHSIHRGENLTNPYVLGTRNYQDLRFPGDLRDCNTCHAGQSYQVDNVGAQAMVATPGQFLPLTGPVAAACQGCHDDKATAAHALANTNSLGEACVVCHGIGAQFAVDTVHARK
jgi:OmcA/MtrC family decaheme c-type cytochrome